MNLVTTTIIAQLKVLASEEQQVILELIAPLETDVWEDWDR